MYFTFQTAEVSSMFVLTSIRVVGLIKNLVEVTYYRSVWACHEI